MEKKSTLKKLGNGFFINHKKQILNIENFLFIKLQAPIQNWK